MSLLDGQTVLPDEQIDASFESEGNGKLPIRRAASLNEDPFVRDVKYAERLMESYELLTDPERHHIDQLRVSHTYYDDDKSDVQSIVYCDLKAKLLQLTAIQLQMFDCIVSAWKEGIKQSNRKPAADVGESQQNGEYVWRSQDSSCKRFKGLPGPTRSN